MNQSNRYYKDLLDKYLSGDILESELNELFAFLANQPEKADQLLGIDNLQAFKEKLQNSPALPVETSERMHAQLLSKINKVRNLPEKNRSSFRYIIAAAASILLIIGAGFYFLQFDKKTTSTPIDTLAKNSEVRAPATNRATITLANGQKILLDSLDTTMALQGTVQLVKTPDGELVYESMSNTGEGETSYNTLENPRGSTLVRMTLVDGTRVWLNAGSSITYPVVFSISERHVSVDGEVYLEVAHDESKPFIVAKNDVTVRVLGTSFNVQAYNNEKTIEVTLLTGSVKVTKGEKSSTLKPGQQARISENKIVSQAANIANVMSWKNGVFRFDRTPLDVLMRQVERWYDVEVLYENGIPDIQLGGEIKRDLSLPQLIEGLGELGVQFEIKGKRLYVKQ
jgi:transmembrane sensor